MQIKLLIKYSEIDKSNIEVSLRGLGFFFAEQITQIPNKILINNAYGMIMVAYFEP